MPAMVMNRRTSMWNVMIAKRRFGSIQFVSNEVGAFRERNCVENLTFGKPSAESQASLKRWLESRGT